MSASIPVSHAQSEFRVEKAKTEATLTLSNGTLVHGSFFLAGSTGTHAGPERIKDVLNAEPFFFPFEVGGAGKSRTILVNREHVVVAKLQSGAEAQSEPGYNVATRRQVSMLLSDGVRLQGVECLSACNNGCAVALSAPGCWTYVYGRLSEADIPEILSGAAAYAASPDGIVPWRERPVIFRKQSLARIPPLEANHD